MINPKLLVRAMVLRSRGTADAHLYSAKCLRLSGLAMVVMLFCAWPALDSFATDGRDSSRSGYPAVVLENGGMNQSPDLPRELNAPPTSSNTRAPRGLQKSSSRCAALRKKYAKSEACFAKYRMINRGLRSGAFKQCRQVKDPSSECGSTAAP
jgi:hypothetical protein